MGFWEGFLMTLKEKIRAFLLKYEYEVKHDIDTMTIPECHEAWDELTPNQRIIVAKRVLEAQQEFLDGTKKLYEDIKK